MGSIPIQMKTKQYMGNFIHIKLNSIQYNWQILNIATCHLHLNNKRRGLNFSETNTLQTIGKYMYMALCSLWNLIKIKTNNAKIRWKKLTADANQNQNKTLRRLSTRLFLNFEFSLFLAENSVLLTVIQGRRETAASPWLTDDGQLLPYTGEFEGPTNTAGTLRLAFTFEGKWRSVVPNNRYYEAVCET